MESFRACLCDPYSRGVKYFIYTYSRHKRQVIFRVFVYREYFSSLIAEYPTCVITYRNINSFELSLVIKLVIN